MVVGQPITDPISGPSLDFTFHVWPKLENILQLDKVDINCFEPSKGWDDFFQNDFEWPKMDFKHNFKRCGKKEKGNLDSPMSLTSYGPPPHPTYITTHNF